MEALPDREVNGRNYRLWLTPLDETDDQQPIPFQTVEELFAALFARWDNRNQAPADT